MSLSATTTYRLFAGPTGTVFSFPYPVYDSAHLVVTKTTTGTSTKTGSALVDGVDYTVTGHGFGSTSCTVTLTTDLGAYGLLIERVVPITQDLVLENQGAFFPKSIEQRLDELVMMLQQQQTSVDRQLLMALSESGWDLTIPTPVQGYVLGFDVATKTLTMQVGGATGPAGSNGADGAPGAKWYSQAGAPAGGTGIVGDWDLNTTTYEIYEKTGASTWTSRGNIKGGGATPAHREVVAYYEAVMTTADLQPVMRVPAARSLARVDYYMDTSGYTTVGTTTVLIKKNGATAFTCTLGAGLAQRTMTNLTTTPISWAAGDILEFTVSAAGATPPKALSLILDFTEAL